MNKIDTCWLEQHSLIKHPYTNGPIRDKGGTYPESIQGELDGYSKGRGKFEITIPPLFERPLLFVKFWQRAYLQSGENPDYRWDAPNGQN